MNNKIVYYYNYTHGFILFIINYIKNLYRKYFPDNNDNSSSDIVSSFSNETCENLFEYVSNSDPEELTEIKIEQINKFLEDYTIIDHEVKIN